MISNYQNFYQTIKDDILNSKLNIGEIYFILKDIMHDIENLYYAKINEELISLTTTEESISLNNTGEKGE